MTEQVTEQVMGQAAIRRRMAVERRIVERVVDDLLDAGYAIAINNGGEGDELGETRDRGLILSHVALADWDLLVAQNLDGRRRGWVRLVYGNDGWDVVNDHTLNLEDALARSTKLAEELEAGCAG